MKRNPSTSLSLLTNLLMVGLILSGSAGVRASSALVQTAGDPGPDSVRSLGNLSRNYALTVVPSQRTAGDVSKHNSLKRSLIHGGLARRESNLPANTLRGFLVANEHSLSYLSFRLIRTGSRAPPSLA
jgi:hypothetical protein